MGHLFLVDDGILCQINLYSNPPILYKLFLYIFSGKIIFKCISCIFGHVSFLGICHKVNWLRKGTTCEWGSFIFDMLSYVWNLHVLTLGKCMLLWNIFLTLIWQQHLRDFTHRNFIDVHVIDHCLHLLGRSLSDSYRCSMLFIHPCCQPCITHELYSC